MARFILNETSYFGAGSRENLATEISKRGYDKAFIVADKDLISFGIVELVTNVISEYPYEISLERKALSRIIHNLTDSPQYAVFQDKSGVWVEQEKKG